MFQKIGWSAQLLAGLVLFGVSFMLEALVLTAYLANALLAFAVAIGLEGSKVLAIMLYRLLHDQSEVPYPRSVQWTALIFRSALLALSGACSVMFLAERLDRPNLEAVRAADLAGAQMQYEQDLTAAQNGYAQHREQALARLAEQDRRQREALGQRYLPAIQDLEAKLDAEMDYVVGGEFKGKRYRELASRLQGEKDAYAQALAALDGTSSTGQGALIERLEQDRRGQLEGLTHRHDERLAAIRNATYEGDYRVEHPTARAFVSVLGAVFHAQPSTLQFVFFFSLFVSATVELGIWVAFEHVTLARLPVFRAEHRAELHVGRKAAETDSELRSFAMDDELARAKVRRKRESIEDTLRATPSDKLAEAKGGARPVR